MCIIFNFSASPFMGLMLLLMGSARVATMAGFYISSWLFLITILVYVGGVIVIFVYLTSLISEAKILVFRVRAIPFVTLLMLPLLCLNVNHLRRFRGPFWIRQMIDLSARTLVVYCILYLLVALGRVFLIAGKLSGPLRSYH